jgi:hypothetical protein
MSNAILEEEDIGITQLYAEALLDYYIPKYYASVLPNDENSTEDPNDSKPGII